MFTLDARIRDGYLVFPGFLPGSWGVCHLRIVRGERKTLYLASEIRHNPGPSITNAIQGVWRAIQERYCPSDHAVLVEHYSDAAVYGDEWLGSRLAKVRIQDGCPFWQHITGEALATEAGCSVADFTVPHDRLVMPVQAGNKGNREP